MLLLIICLILLGQYYQDYDYNFVVYTKGEDATTILGFEDIEEYYKSYRIRHGMFIEDFSKVNSQDEYLKNYIQFDDYMSIEIIGLDDISFRKYTKKAGLNYQNVKDKGILVDSISYTDDNGNAKKTRIYNYMIGDNISCGNLITDDNGKYTKISDVKNIEIGGITETKPYGTERSFYNGGILVVDIDYFKNIGLELSSIMIQSSNPNNLETNINNLNKTDTIHIWNIEEEIRSERSMSLVIKIFLYGFIGVITLIGVTNIFNTITSNMELRQKEFAMLKSIGMTSREFNRMINLETIFYGTKSLMYGIILGLLGTFALYRAFEIKDNANFYMPINAIIISIVAVFILVSIIMKYSIGKINRQNTIETIRKDNI